MSMSQPKPHDALSVPRVDADLSHLPEANRKALRELGAYVAANPPRTELGRLAIELRRLCLLEGEKLLSDQEFWAQIDRERGRN